MNECRTIDALFEAFRQRQMVDLCGYRYGLVINTLQHEDGSGRSFNVTCQNGQRFYLRYFENGTRCTMREVMVACPIGWDKL